MWDLPTGHYFILFDFLFCSLPFSYVLPLLHQKFPYVLPLLKKKLKIKGRGAYLNLIKEKIREIRNIGD
jgi:hypothetical protein